MSIVLPSRRRTAALVAGLAVAVAAVLVTAAGSGAAAPGGGKPKPTVVLVYIAGFAPGTGETALELTNKFPGSTLEQIPLGGGAVDLRVRQDQFPQQFAADVPPPDARLMAVAQRPVAALGEPSPPTS
jgi:ABC-type glycerol-3-phosphate transport system substrate-binding protein